MNNLTPAGMEHAPVVVEVIVAVFVGVVFLLGVIWGAFLWLRGVIRSEFTALGPALVAALEKRHDELERRVNSLETYKSENIETVKRLHARVDRAWERMAGGHREE